MANLKSKILQLYLESYYNQADIARHLGCSEKYVSKVVAACKVDPSHIAAQRKAALFSSISVTLKKRLDQLKDMIETGLTPLPAMLVEIKYLERISKMFGLDAAEQVDVSIQALPTKAEYVIDVDTENQSS